MEKEPLLHPLHVEDPNLRVAISTLALHQFSLCVLKKGRRLCIVSQDVLGFQTRCELLDLSDPLVLASQLPSRLLLCSFFAPIPWYVLFSCARLCFSASLSLLWDCNPKTRQSPQKLCPASHLIVLRPVFCWGCQDLRTVGVERRVAASWAFLLACVALPERLSCFYCLAFCCCSIACSSNRPRRRPLCPVLCVTTTTYSPRVQDESLYSAGLCQTIAQTHSAKPISIGPSSAARSHPFYSFLPFFSLPSLSAPWPHSGTTTRRRHLYTANPATRAPFRHAPSCCLRVAHGPRPRCC